MAIWTTVLVCAGRNSTPALEGKVEGKVEERRLGTSSSAPTYQDALTYKLPRHILRVHVYRTQLRASCRSQNKTCAWCHILFMN